MQGFARESRLNITDERILSVVVFSSYFSWILSFPFEGQILYSLAGRFQIEPHSLLFGSIFAQFVGLFLCGFLIRSMKEAKRLLLFSILFCMAASSLFFFEPSFLWNVALVSASFLAGAGVAAWGFYFQSGTAKNERIKTAADALIYSNILMIVINMLAIHLSPYAGIGLSILLLACAFYLTLRLPEQAERASFPRPVKAPKPEDILKPLAFLCFFIVVITINSGLMYQVINPAFSHLEWLTGFYWAVPYIVALFIMRNLPGKANRPYILYVAIAMIGLAFIAFMNLNRTAGGYLIVNTLMLGACGVFDLFWWSILGEMLDLGENPARILGAGLSANVLGVLIGGFVGNAIYAEETHNYSPSVLALVVIFVVLILLPVLNRQLTRILKNHAYLTQLSEEPMPQQDEVIGSFVASGRLTGREGEIASLLLKGRPYKLIADELYLSENTVKTHIKNIYSKFHVKGRSELIRLMMENEKTI